MLFEATDEWEMETFAIELNLYVNTILTSVMTHAGARPIMFSSFSPEICILSSQKQARYPVLFLNCGGNWPTGDIRASSLQEAVHFAKAWKLDGIVMESDPLVLAPRLIRSVRECGLVCASYGTLNNNPQFAKVSTARFLIRFPIPYSFPGHMRNCSLTINFLLAGPGRCGSQRPNRR
jgi:glycerophosphoryl diester phosphodiesterase